VRWEFTDDVAAYADAVGPVLAAQPERFTIALSVVDNVRHGLRWSDLPMHFGWHVRGDVVDGVVLVTPPFPLVISVLAQDAVDDLVGDLLSRGATLTGVNGERDDAVRFAAAWSARTGAAATTSVEERLYRLGTLAPVTPLPPGGARRAGPGDLDLVSRWHRAFIAEALPDEPDVDHTDVIRHRLESGLLWLWQVDGEPAAMAGRTAPAAGVARVGPVYTPPAQRGRGFGSAVTAACTQDALDAGAEGVVLFTDLANPTSNAIYQRLGYRPVVDRVVVRFSP
jgi:predicted GNAT family acetyltransferase